MYSKESLLDIHERCHASFGRCLEHCCGLSADELDRELDGFGYATVRLQLHHMVSAERYWIAVVRDCLDATEDEADAASTELLKSFRDSVRDATREYLRGVSDEELSTPRTMTTWGGHERMLAPAHVILRTQTHLYHHMGQIAAMCRLLGHAIPEGSDFPLT